ncbi:WD40 repeat domain-containing protein [Streptomyces sp. NBC_01451]|uniref:WD40 repeat domain-containing protein n=1 Tax=Streptomyces sp. NBC_01451 TaxID=2903872 RepID=UPI002E34BDA6|nr:WD40 repeat domain-containing protein [Streptomyces sp. NBC_01451]
MAIGKYSDPHLPDLDAEPQVGHLYDLLAAFNVAQHPWATPASERGAGAVERRLRQWADAGGEPQAPANTVLYWVGHGWSDGLNAALAHADSPARTGEAGVTPEHLADAIRTRQALALLRAGDEGVQGWTMVVVDTCRSRRFVERLASVLNAHNPPRRVLLMGVSGEGATTLGRFTAALRAALSTTYRADAEISLIDLVNQFHRLLPDCAITVLGDMTDAVLTPVMPPVGSWMSAPLDEIRHLEDVIDDLSPDERRHFLAKAQGAEHGEISWFFEGREQQIAQIDSWLRQSVTGMLVVTGRAGSGKSALLGNVVVHALPELRSALARRGLISAHEHDGIATDPVFDAVIHLSGLSLSQATARIATAAGLGPLPSQIREDAGLATDLDWLIDGLTRRHKPFTVLTDALDEAVDPLDTARSLLARLTSVPLVRVLVGTRASTNELPDVPARDENVLDALSSFTDAIEYVRVTWEAEAIHRYVVRRLRTARDHGSRGVTAANRGIIDGWQDEDIERVADTIARRDREFLYARLAVYEILEDPRLLTPGRAWSLDLLLAGDHNDLFGKAIGRLAQTNDRHPLLLRALALGHGRGVPESDGVWAALAASVGPSTMRVDWSQGAPSDSVHSDIAWAEVMGELLERAAAYVVIDTTGVEGTQARAEHGGETVYRLAHRTFIEYFLARDPEQAVRDRHNAARALLSIAAGSKAPAMPAYLARHLSGHVAEADLWEQLAELPSVLDRLQPRAITADALRTLFGRKAVPPPVAGVIGACEVLEKAHPGDRPGLRQLSMAKYSGRQIAEESTGGWGIASARIGHMTVHAQLSGHSAPVNRVRGLSLFDGRSTLASAGDDGTIRLWDAEHATPIGPPMHGHHGTIEDICAFLGPNDRTLLASAGGDRTVRIWDLSTGRQVGGPLTGHRGRVWGVCPLPGWDADGNPDDRNLIAAADDGTVRVWDPMSGELRGAPLTGHTGGVWSLCTLPGRGFDGFPERTTLLATGGQDGTVRIWDPGSGSQVGEQIIANSGGIRSMCALPGWAPDGRSILATAGDDGMTHLWDPVDGRRIGVPLEGHVGRVWGVCAVTNENAEGIPERTLLATTGQDGSIRLWDPVAGRQIGPSLAGHDGRVMGVCAVPRLQTSRGRSLLASAGQDGTVRIWDPAVSEDRETDPFADRAVRVRAVSPLNRGLGKSTLVANAADDGTVRIWDPALGCQIGRTLGGHRGAVLGICTLPIPNQHHGTDPGTFRLATAGRDGTVRIWDPVVGRQSGPPLTGHEGRVWGICTLPGWGSDGTSDGSTLLATTGQDGTVRIWDPVAGRQSGPPLTGHEGRVRGICTLPGWGSDGTSDGSTLLATTGQDGTVRIWDPVAGRQSGPPLTGHEGRALGICCFPARDAASGLLLASTGEDGTVRVWDPVTGHQLGLPLVGHTGGVWAVCAFPAPADGKSTGYSTAAPMLLATAGEDGTVRVWDPIAGRQLGAPFNGHAGAVFDVRVVPGSDATGHPDGHALLATAGEDGTVRVWDPWTERLVGEAFLPSSRTVRALAPMEVSDTQCVVLTSNGALSTWDAATTALEPIRMRAGVSAVASLGEHGHGTLAVCHTNGLVQLMDRHGSPTAADSLLIDGDSALTVGHLPAPGGGRGHFVEAGSAGFITEFTFDKGIRHTFRAHHAPIRDLRLVEPSGGQPALLASAGNDGTIHIWDATTWVRRARLLPGHKGWVWSLALLPGGTAHAPTLVSAGSDGVIRVWDPYAGSQVGSDLLGHDDQVRALVVATSPDGSMLLVSGGHDGTVRLWCPFTGSLIRTIPLGAPVHALLQQPAREADLRRTTDGATITVGLQTGILLLDIHGSLFCSE